MSRSKFSYQQEIEELKRALIAKDKEIERLKFGKLIFSGKIIALHSEHDYTHDDIVGSTWRNYTATPTTYTLEVKLLDLKLTPDDMSRLSSGRRLKFVAELDNEGVA